MSIYSWTLPSPPAAPLVSSTVAALFGAILPTALGGMTDIALDPITRDYVRTDNGEWLETADSRTLVMIALEVEYGASPYDWTDGTRIKALINNADGDPLEPAFVASETKRALETLVREGIIADLTVKIFDDSGATIVDESGRTTCLVWWRDLASGNVVDLYYTPQE